MLIDIQIARTLQRQIEPAMPRKQLQHVIKKPNPRRHLVDTLPIDRQLQCNLRLGRISSDRCCPHTLSHYSNSLTDRKSTRLNSSHSQISYAVFCLKKKTN